MTLTIRTVQGARFSSAKSIGKNPEFDPRVTLNTKFSVQENVSHSDNDVLKIGYMAIGDWGHIWQTGKTSPVPVPHSPEDAACYRHIPFVAREISNDLSPSERSKYRMRVVRVIGTKTYALYFIRVIDLSLTTPTIEYRVVKDGNVTSKPYTPSSANLNPERPAVVTDQSIDTSGTLIAVTSKIPFVMTETDMSELRNVGIVLYNDEMAGLISEFALVSGVDRVVSGNFGGTIANYTEIISATVTHFGSAFMHCIFDNVGKSTSLDLGTVEPLQSL